MIEIFKHMMLALGAFYLLWRIASMFVLLAKQALRGSPERSRIHSTDQDLA